MTTLKHGSPGPWQWSFMHRHHAGSFMDWSLLEELSYLHSSSFYQMAVLLWEEQMTPMDIGHSLNTCLLLCPHVSGLSRECLSYGTARAQTKCAPRLGAGRCSGVRVMVTFTWVCPFLRVGHVHSHHLPAAVTAPAALPSVPVMPFSSYWDKWCFCCVIWDVRGGISMLYGCVRWEADILVFFADMEMQARTALQSVFKWTWGACQRPVRCLSLEITILCLRAWQALRVPGLDLDRKAGLGDLHLGALSCTAWIQPHM